MDKDKLLEWIRESLKLLCDDLYLLEHGVNERCITAKLGCHMHVRLKDVAGEKNAEMPTDKRLHVDCEYNRFGDDTKWFPWDLPILDEARKEIYYAPIPDIILHCRGPEGPNILVIEAKKADNANEFTALIDRLKLIGYLGPNMNYEFGLYLSLGHSKGGLVVATAEMVEYETVKAAMNGSGKAIWNRCTKLVESELDNNGRVYLCREPDKKKKTQASTLCLEMAKVFSFANVVSSLID
jgi:hypothetical protein